jgi:hypothetical protein
LEVIAEEYLYTALFTYDDEIEEVMMTGMYSRDVK